MQFKFPQTKPMLVPYINKTNDGVHFGGFQENIAREIIVDDPKMLYSFLLTLNGNNSVEKISELNDMKMSDVIDLLKSLQKAGVIFENDNSNLDFSPEEELIYSRNLNFFAWIDTEGKFYNYWEVQKRLKYASVLVLGAGGAGGNCAISLAELGIGHLTILDKDKVELSNLNRQPYTIYDIGKFKVDAIKKHILDRNPFIEVKSIQREIKTLADLENIGKNFDIILDGIDVPKEFPDVLDEYNKKYGTPWILGGYASTVVNHAFFDGSTEKFLSHLKKEHSEDFDGSQIDKETNWSWKNAVISPVTQVSAAFSALYAMYYLTGLRDLIPGAVQHIDMFNIQDMKNFTYILGDYNAK